MYEVRRQAFLFILLKEVREIKEVKEVKDRDSLTSLISLKLSQEPQVTRVKRP